MRRSKIISTLGPASNSESVIKELILAGVDVFRLNMSHGSHEQHKETIELIRQCSRDLKKITGILMDLQGPKIRVAAMDKPIQLNDGEIVIIGTEEDVKNHQTDLKKIPSGYKDLTKDLKPNCRVLFDDGKLVAKSIKKEGNCFQLEIISGGELKQKKGINLPDCRVSAKAFTEKDKKDLMFGLQQEVDYFALSFVGNKEDVLAVRYLLHELRVPQKIISKIERPHAIDDIDEIIKVSDAIMVARGDMGVELGNHLVPAVQKEIIRKCNAVGVPVITATQMLESMVDNPTPTRAEASDVANAIWDGTDAVMLSGETAAGKFPVYAVKMMHQIVLEAEKRPRERPLMRNIDLSSVSASVMVAASLIAEKIEAKRIVSVTQSGNSCLKLSRFRPTTQALGVTNNIKVARRMSLYWGVTPFLIEEENGAENIEARVIEKIRKKLNLENGDKLVISRGDGAFFEEGRSNNVRVEILKDIPKVRGGSDTLKTADFKGGQINLDTFSCGTCFNCVNVCPHDIWEINKDGGHHVTINESKVDHCTVDMECVNRCPTGSIEIIPSR